MRRVVIAQVALLCAMSATVGRASPGGLDVLSSYQRIWGSAQCEMVGDMYIIPEDRWIHVDQNYQESYSEEGPWDGARLLTGVQPYPSIYAWSHMDALYAAVGGNAPPQGEIWEYPYDGALCSEIDCTESYARGYWDFRPHGRELLLEVDLFGGIKEEYPPPELFPGDHEHPCESFAGDPLTIVLDDLTAGVRMYDFNGSGADFYVSFGGPGWHDGIWTAHYSVNPAHDYRLYVDMASTANNDGPWRGIVRAQVVPVPVPGGILLGALGLGCVRCLRRRGML